MGKKNSGDCWRSRHRSAGMGEGSGCGKGEKGKLPERFQNGALMNDTAGMETKTDDQRRQRSESELLEVW